MQDKIIEVAPITRFCSRRSFLIKAGVFVAGTTISDLPFSIVLAGSTNIRRSIDSLHPDELKQYVDTVAEMVRRGKTDPNDKTGYAYLANLHNDFQNFGCEHHWAAFLPWHRAMLWISEQALQSVSGITSLTLPYWNWSEAPTGPRYPKAFEDQSSILYDDVTGWDQRNRAPHSLPAFSAKALEKTILDSKGNWSLWGGGSLANRTGGSLEEPYHDDMHTGYIGGAIFNPDTAANDPIFFSFHAFIDLYWVRWQRTWGGNLTTNLNHKLRGLKNTPVATIGDVVDINTLNYDYDNAPPVSMPSVPFLAPLEPKSLKAANEFSEMHPDIFAAAGEDEPDIIYGFDIVIPAPEFETARIVLSDVGYSSTLSYRGYVFLHPKSVAFNPQDAAFRESYLVAFYSIWRAMMEGLKTNVTIDVSQVLSYIAKSAQGQNWRVSIAISPVRDPKKTTLRALGTVGVTALARETSIGSFSLDIDN